MSDKRPDALPKARERDTWAEEAPAHDDHEADRDVRTGDAPTPPEPPPRMPELGLPSGAFSYLTLGVVAGIPVGFGVVLVATIVLSVNDVSLEDGTALGMAAVGVGIVAAMWEFRSDSRTGRRERLLVVGALLGLAVDVALWAMLMSNCTFGSFN